MLYDNFKFKSRKISGSSIKVPVKLNIGIFSHFFMGFKKKDFVARNNAPNADYLFTATFTSIQ